MRRTDQEDLPIFVKWMEFLEWLMPATEKFPKRARFSFSQRIECLALDVAEALVEARYSRNKQMQLQAINLKLEKLRVLIRLSHSLKFLSHEGYQHATRSINEVGKILGSWIKSLSGESTDIQGTQ